MKIKLISFSESKMVAMNATHGVITDKIEEIMGIEEEFLFCHTQKEMFAGVKDGVENADVIVLAVDVSRFISTKASLFRALGFKCRLNGEITNLIDSDLCMATLNENQVKAHAAIPVGGEAFITNDGLFSGFGIESGKQKLIFIPIDEKRIGAILENGMIAFLSKGVEKAIPEEQPVESDIPAEMEGYVEPIEDFEEPAADEEDDSAQTDVYAEPQYEEIYSAASQTTEEEEEKGDFEDISSSSIGSDVSAEVPAGIENRAPFGVFSGSLTMLEQRGVKVAFVRHNANETYAKLLQSIEDSSSVIMVDRAMEKYPEEEMKIKECLANVAKNALRGIDAEYAVAMTEIFKTEDGLSLVFAAVSDGTRASVYKIYSSDESESPEELYKAGLEGVFERLEAKTVDHSVSQDGSAPGMGNAVLPSKNKMTPATQIIIWALIIVALCALSALIIDTVMSNSASLGEASAALTSEIGKFFSR